MKVSDSMLHTLSVAFLFSVLGAIAGAYFGVLFAAAGIVSVMAVLGACYVAGLGLEGSDNGEE